MKTIYTAICVMKIALERIFGPKREGWSDGRVEKAA
jgi:hypothetical protein